MTPGPPQPFHPLDADERLPREDLRPGRGGLSFRTINAAWRRLSGTEIAAVVAIPALVVLGVVVGEFHVPFPVAVAAFALLFLALAVLALSGRRPPTH